MDEDTLVKAVEEAHSFLKDHGYSDDEIEQIALKLAEWVHGD